MLSINTNKNDILNFKYLISNFHFNLNNFLIIINFLRFICPFILCISLFALILKNKLNYKFNFLITVFFFYELWKIIIYILTEKDQFSPDIFQISFSLISLVLIFHIAEHLKIFNIYKKFYNIFIVFISIITILFSIYLFKSIDFSKNFYFYGIELLTPGKNFFLQEMPRVTGLGRLSLIILIFLFFYLTSKKHTLKIKILLYLSIFFLSTKIYFLQSRGVYVGLILLIIFFYFFSKKKFIEKFFLIFILIMPNIVGESLKYTFKSLSEKKQFIPNEINLIDNRLFFNHTSSGRIEIWKRSLDIIIKEKILIGHGPQTDRKLISKYLKDNQINKSILILDNNASNALLYAYLCGGIVGFVLLIIVYFLFIKEIIRSIFIKKILIVEKNIYTNSSVVILMYLILRSFFENSFALFSVDLFLGLLSYFYLLNFNKNKY
jgi:hypothetical protein